MQATDFSSPAPAVVDDDLTNHGNKIPKDGGVTIPSSLPEEADQKTLVSAFTCSSVRSEEENHHGHEIAGNDNDAVHVGDGGVIVDMEDDQDVQSQIALELSQQSQSQSQQEQRDREPTPPPVSLVEGEVEEAMEVDESDGVAREGPDENDHDMEEISIIHDSAERKEALEQNQEAIGQREKEEQTEGGLLQQQQNQQQTSVQKLMGFLRGGLDILRSARLSRQEVYEIEDMFMDMKKELYMAESRGRERSRSIVSAPGGGGDGERSSAAGERSLAK